MVMEFWERQALSFQPFFLQKLICSAKSGFLVQPVQTNIRYQAVSGFPSDTLEDNKTA